MTIGGISATRAVRGADNNTRQLNSEIWYAVVPTGTSGDIVMTESGNTVSHRALDIYNLIGFTATSHATAGNESLSDLSLSVTDGGFALALATNQQSTTPPTLTGITNTTTISQGTRQGAKFGAQSTSAGTLTIGSNLGAVNEACKCAASWAVAPP